MGVALRRVTVSARPILFFFTMEFNNALKVRLLPA